MATNFQLTANILSVTFLPRDFIHIHGMVWSKHRKSHWVHDDYNRYNKRWFWTNETPGPVTAVLTEIADNATEELVAKQALPTFWPKGLMAEEQHYPFDISIAEITVFNSDWDKDRLNEVKFKTTSKHHFEEGTYNESVVTFDGGWKLNDEIFKILEIHM